MWYALAAIQILMLAYVPGALIFRAPVGRRAQRASLPAEERAFWAVMISLTLSSIAALALAAGGAYRFNRLLAIDGGISLLLVAIGRRHLRLGSTAPAPTWTALVPIALIAGGLSLNFFVPPAEYIIGGRDPGVYVNEGIQIAQRGSLAIVDPTVSSVPPPYRDLFFPWSHDPNYYGLRFMGFFLMSPDTGVVVGQLPHLYPTWMAVAYGINGLSGARQVVGLWAVLGLVAVYFAGTRIVGRAAAAAGAGLLCVHVVQVWYARYPNAEMMMQPLVFAGLAAFVRAEVDEDRFFAPLAALLLGLCMFDHLTGAIVVGSVAAAALLGFIDGRRLPILFGVTLLLGACLGVTYLATFVSPYFAGAIEFFRNLRPMMLPLLAIAAVGIAAVALLRRARIAGLVSPLRVVSISMVVAIWVLAAYAMFFRTGGGSRALFDADSLRTFTSFYLTGYGLCAALIGFTLLALGSREASAFLVTCAVFAVLFFYKIRIVPEHFWAARRFLAVVLPGMLLLVGAAAFADVRVSPSSTGLAWINSRRFRTARYAAGIILVASLAVHFSRATQPILRHVEYAGLIPHVEQMASTFGDDDLVLVESRGASDSHVLALPLAYIYARHVLVFARTDPAKDTFRDFLSWARGRYRRVFFVGGGGGGTELLSRRMTVVPIRGERFQVPEYDSPYNAYPKGVRFKEFDLSVYEFLDRPVEETHFVLDVGAADDLYVRRFHGKEQSPAGFTYRWTRDLSFVSIVGIRPDYRRLTMWMSNGGRPPAAGPATMDVSVNDRPLGSVTVGADVLPYDFEIPADLAVVLAQSESAAELRLTTRTWNPGKLGIGGDSRDLGVMLDRVEVR